MEKINFENLPGTNTPINATNLNQLQTNFENAISWKQATNNGDGTMTVPISWDELKEISIRTLGTDSASFAFLTIPKEQWHNDGTYVIGVPCFNYEGGHAGYGRYSVTQKNTDNFVITKEGTAVDTQIYYK